MDRKLALLFCLVGLFSFFVQAQQPYLKHFTVDDGLPSNEVYQVVQDEKGNLLAATDRGAVRYDGYSFTDVAPENGPTSKPVYYIYQSAPQKIYFSSLQGLIYQYRNDSLYSYAHNQKAASLFKHPGILIANSISDKRDTLWISYNNDYNYIYKVGTCYVTAKGKVEKLNKPDGIYFDLAHQFYFRQLSASNYNLAKQPVHITWPNGTITRDSIEINWRGGYIRRLFYDSVGDCQLFCIGRKLLVYKNQQPVSRYTLPENVLYLARNGSSGFYIGFENIGALGYKLTNGTITSTGEQFLNGYSVTCIYKDHQDGTWFSTLEDGLFYRYPSNTSYWENESKITGIQKRKNRIYVGYYSGLLQAFEKGKPVYQTHLPLNNGSYLSRITFDQNDSLIAITDKGFYTRRGSTWQFHASQEALLLAVKKGLVFGASASSPELHIYSSLEQGAVQKQVLSKRIISMFADSKQQLWIGTWEGLLKYENNKLIDVGNKCAVFRDRIVAIDELPDQSLVVASLGNGLAISRGDQIFTLNTGNGLRSPIINSMVIDSNNIWLGTNKGLSKINFTNGKFTVAHLGIEAGLPTADIHAFTVNAGLLYIKWINRVVTADAARLMAPENKTQTHLTSLLINDEEPASLAGHRFNHQQNTLTFGFTCPNLAAAYQQEYRYMMEGFDKTWHSTKERYVKYTNLPPGRFVFNVQAVNLQNRTSSAVTGFTFTISPAFWQTWWFLLLAFFLTAVLLFSVFQWRVNAIKRKNQLVLELAENRQKVLVQLIHPHFVFNVLNTIQGAILKQEKMLAASLVSKFAKLMRLSMELSKEKMVRLEKEMALLHKYFELEEIRSPGRFAYEIDLAPALQPDAILIPSMLIQPFVENAIKHGVMHLQNKKGCIRIGFALQDGTLLCTVDDNGIGRQESEKINRTKRKEHQSSGIEITVNRLDLLHKEKGSAFFYQVNDKKSPDGEPQGTTIIFSIPYQKTDEKHSRTDHR